MLKTVEQLHEEIELLVFHIQQTVWDNTTTTNQRTTENNYPKKIRDQNFAKRKLKRK